MSEELELLKKRLLYRASYRGTKEMDILVKSFVDCIINKLDLNQLEELDKFVNLDDETLQQIKNKKDLNHNFNRDIVHMFQTFDR